LVIKNRSRCSSCQSDNVRGFDAEIALHFPGIAGLVKPIVWAFPRVEVCLNCGLSEFLVTEGDLKALESDGVTDPEAVSFS
jgi:hypothetical protein